MGVSGCQGREVRGECEWAAPEQSRGGARLFGPFHMSVCRALLSNGLASIDKLRKPSPAESELERRRLSDGIFPPPLTKQDRAACSLLSSWECRDAQGRDTAICASLWLLRYSIRHRAMQDMQDMAQEETCKSWDDQAFDSSVQSIGSGTCLLATLAARHHKYTGAGPA